MKILFVCSGNSPNGISPIVKSQGESLKKCGIEVDYFTIVGKGIIGYLKNVKILKKIIRGKKYDLIHAHYVLCGWVTLFAAPFLDLVVSYMGSDVYGSYDKEGKMRKSRIYLIILAKILQPFAKKIIVKSKNLFNYIYMKNKTHIVPNGVNLNVFKPFEQQKSKEKLKLSRHKKYILFLGDTDNERKNFQLLYSAYKNINNGNLELITPYPIEHNEIPLYFSACDLIALTSYNEGSPNVIKEAMACNCPIVSTDVGDVKWILGETEGCYITTFDPNDLAKKIEKALDFGKRTKGRERIKILGLDSETIAIKTIKIYESCTD